MVPGNANWGFVEFLDNSTSFQDFDDNDGGHNGFANAIANFSDDELEVFMRTAVGSYVSGYVLGLGDRHKDNFMIKGEPYTGVATTVLSLNKTILRRRKSGLASGFQTLLGEKNPCRRCKLSYSGSSECSCIILRHVFI